jgi:hypothetical protein
MDGAEDRSRRRLPGAKPRNPVAVTITRAIGLAATVALLTVGVVVASMLAGGGDDPAEEIAAAPTTTSAPTATATAKPKPPRPRLTPAQRRSRRAAVEQLRGQGFEPVSVATYRPRQTLRVLIGKPQASVGTRGRRAFFFVREEYLGTDAAEPSQRVRVVRQSDSAITLAYTLFAPGDKPCCPSAGTARVRFAWKDGRLAAAEPLPAAAMRLPPA